MMEVLGLLLPRLFVTLWGLFWLFTFSCVALWDAHVLGRPGKATLEQIEKARKRIWDSPEINHEFLTLSTGLKMHYISNLHSNTEQKRNLTVFIHGWPNSCMLWREFLTAPKLNDDNAMVALDLPGFGLSDVLPNYGPNEVFNAVSEFILEIISRHTTKDKNNKRKGRMVIVGHDWGAYVTIRLATDVPKLADRFVVSNFPPPSVIKTNVDYRRAEFQRLIFSWAQNVTQIHHLPAAFRAIGPVLAQLVKSSYVFIFQLPVPLRSAFGSRGNYWFWRSANALAMNRKHGNDRTEQFAELMAGSLGSTVTPVKFHETIRLYSEGIISRPWVKSDIVAGLLKSHTAHVRDTPTTGLAPGSLNAPTTVIWGGQDVAIENAISLEGIEDHLPIGSQVIVLAKVGHWTPVDDTGRQAIENIVLWSLKGEKDAVSRQLKELSAEITVEK